MKTTTLDNGVENKHHERWGVPTFSRMPTARGRNRSSKFDRTPTQWFFPKGTDWAKVTEEEFQTALTILNHKYRKSLKYQNALEVARAHGIMKKVPKEKNRTEYAIH